MADRHTNIVRRRRGAEWSSVDEDPWLASEIVLGTPMASLHTKTPGDGNRTQVGVSIQISDMRTQSVLPSRWTDPFYAARDSNNWKTSEDVEILQWHVWGRKAIDAHVFWDMDRSAKGVAQRADYLCQDQGLVDEAKRAEQQAAQKQSAECDRAAELTIGGAISKSLRNRG
ncbi:conserved hypothetical protein [Paecilomyces variotii No. 5]|uniref:Uncharacterized protein n=1 Tax=Byssochlamys spectabilis (strain No. 5 / NBRC 109023) TaxID=1356009 RepID=V5GBT7_BYSSN|nr:conserved hypothetical protein [Paecilomyces variotii No. 5]